jgi:cytochrome c
MRRGYLIPSMAALLLAACGGEAPGPGERPEVAAPKLEDLPAPYDTADVAKGKALFGKKCDSCHTLGWGKQNLVGPNLAYVFDRGTAAKAGYAYSEALKAFAPEMWTPELLDQWLKEPQTFVRKSNMFFEGVHDEAERRDLIAFLLIETRK